MIRLKSLQAFHVSIRLKKVIRHASQQRTSNDTLLVRCELDNGTVGWGEGIPRTYVTGDSMESSWQHILKTQYDALATADFSQPAETIAAADRLELADVPVPDGVISRACFGNTARCALELAVLDAACRCVNQPISHALDLASEELQNDELIKPVAAARYDGVIASGRPFKQHRSAFSMRLFNFAQVKVKVGTAGIDDAACLRRCRRWLGIGVDLRIDANEAWRCDELAKKLAELTPFNISCVEQPVPEADVEGLADVRSDLNVPIMLDESLCCMDDAARAVRLNLCDAFNLRISKCGGLLRTLRLANQAQKRGIGVQLGCLVGETGLLSAAGRHFACHVSGIRYLEGSFDRFLVKDRLTAEDLTFRYGGKAPALSGPGLGVTVNEREVAERTVKSHVLYS